MLFDKPAGENPIDQLKVVGRPVDRIVTPLFVARKGGRVIGFCGVEAYPGHRIGLVHGPVVAVESQGRGVNKALFEIALRAGVQHGAAEL